VTREPATLLILAGGESTRMGFPKHRLRVAGRDILSHLHERLGHLFVETIVVGRDISIVPVGIRTVEDRYIARGPLVGIHGGLHASRTDLAFVMGCDMPYVSAVLAGFLLAQAKGHDAAVPVVHGFYEPLGAAYRKACLEPIEWLIGSGLLKVSELYPLINMREVGEEAIRQHDPSLRSFANLNTERELEAAF